METRDSDCGACGGRREHAVESEGFREADRNERAVAAVGMIRKAVQVLRMYRENAADAAKSEDPLAIPSCLASAESVAGTMCALGIALNGYARRFGEGAFASLIAAIPEIHFADACFFRALASQFADAMESGMELGAEREVSP
jgi:hypothetical protein